MSSEERFERIRLEQNNTQPNIYSANTALVIVAVAVFLWIINEFGVFKVDKAIMRINCGITVALCIIVQILGRSQKFNSNKRTKYFIIGCITAIAFCTYLTLNFHASLVVLFPMLLASQYHSVKLSRTALIGSMITAMIAPLIGNFLHTWDEPFLKTMLQLSGTVVTAEQASGLAPWDISNVMQVLLYVGFPEAAIAAAFSPIMFAVTRSGHENIENRIRIMSLNESEIITLNNELKGAIKAEKGAGNAKSRFLFNMSHDIRTPMNAIVGFTNIAERNIDNPEIVKDCIDKIKMSNSYLLQIINDVLDMARIESDKVTIEPSEYDLTESTQRMSEMFGNTMIEKSISYFVDCSGVTDRYVFCDEFRLRQITTNLISNAAKFTKTGGRIEYTIRQLPCIRQGWGSYVFCVKDNGIGMSEEFQRHLFEQFAREQTSTESRQQGTGLGMSIVKRLTDLMGGTIDISSIPGQGTSISVFIDFEIASLKPADTVEQQAIPGLSLNGRRALVVEDNDLNREITVDLLREEGVICEEAMDGARAVEILKKNGPRYYDFILMDVQMPVLDGYGATRQIRAMPDMENLPIIAVSANAFEEDRKKAIEVGMNDSVAKPISVEELMRTLRKYTS